jgi:GTP-binding protein Era
MESPETPLAPVPTGHKSGYVALIGKPNVGKRTLINSLICQKMSIVTDKPQTTRHRVLGILSKEHYQVIFFDTPGVLEPRYKLHEAMMNNVRTALDDADVILMMIAPRDTTPNEQILHLIGRKPVFLLINKVDQIAEREALPLAEIYSQKHTFKEIIPISGLHGHNLDTLIELIVQHLPEGPPFYPRDIISEQPERFFVSEIIREKIFLLYGMEIPYSTEVHILRFEEREDKKDLIDAEIIVERQSQKGIIIGKEGGRLKKVGIAARLDIESFLGREVFLSLHVKVREEWRNRDSLLHSFGYDH